MSTDRLPLIAGVIKGSDIAVGVPVTITTGQAVNGGWSGRFVTLVAAGTVSICTNASTTISGWLESNTIASAAGEVRKMVLPASNVVFRIPVTAATFATSYIGDLVDPTVSSGVQYANLGTNTNDLLLIVGGYAGSAAADSYADVIINPNELFMST